MTIKRWSDRTVVISITVQYVAAKMFRVVAIGHNSVIFKSAFPDVNL